MSSNFTVIYDSCVLYPAPLRDLLMRLALTDLFRARWSRDIHDEWIRNVLKNRPDLKPEQLERTRDLMDSNVRDCLVTGYELLIETIELPDPDDRHVVAAAIKNSIVCATSLQSATILPNGRSKCRGENKDCYFSGYGG